MHKEKVKLDNGGQVSRCCKARVRYMQPYIMLYQQLALFRRSSEPIMWSIIGWIMELEIPIAFLARKSCLDIWQRWGSERAYQTVYTSNMWMNERKKVTNKPHPISDAHIGFGLWVTHAKETMEGERDVHGDRRNPVLNHHRERRLLSHVVRTRYKPNLSLNKC